jgi:transmembrane sensor
MSEDIYNLLAKYFSGNASEAEATAIAQWQNANADNQNDYLLLEKLWRQTGEPEEIEFDTEHALRTVAQQINPSAKGIVRLFTLRRIATIAACILMVWSIWWITRYDEEIRTVVANVPVKMIQLEDGSQVYLRKGAVLQYPRHFSKEQRGVSLRGEAFFEVQHNEEQPFIITAAATRVMVLGTSFSVISQKDSVQLIVKTGLVRFNPIHDTANKVLVTAGQRALYARRRLQQQVNTDENFNAWQSNILVFKNTPLQQVAATLSNHYGIRLELDQQQAAQMANTSVTETFNNQPLNTVLKELSQITSYQVTTISNKHYKISLP